MCYYYNTQIRQQNWVFESFFCIFFLIWWWLRVPGTCTRVQGTGNGYSYLYHHLRGISEESFLPTKNKDALILIYEVKGTSNKQKRESLFFNGFFVCFILQEYHYCYIGKRVVVIIILDTVPRVVVVVNLFIQLLGHFGREANNGKSFL